MVPVIALNIPFLFWSFVCSPTLTALHYHILTSLRQQVMATMKYFNNTWMIFNVDFQTPLLNGKGKHWKLLMIMLLLWLYVVSEVCFP